MSQRSTPRLDSGHGRRGSPRLGIDLRAGLGPIQVSAGLRASYLFHGTESQQLIAGAERTLDWRVHALGFSLPIRVRYPITDRWGISVAGEPVLSYVTTTVDPGFQEPESFAALVFGGAGEVTGDLLIGPGRILLTVRMGSTAVSDGLLVGELDGFAVLVGYSWFFWDIGG